MTERAVQQQIKNYWKGAKAFIPNIYYNDIWEADMLVISREWRFVECEIKTSTRDFANDFRMKPEKHNALDKMFDLTIIPNEYYFVVTEEVATEIELPNYAGLLVVQEKGGKKWLKRRVSAPILHNEKVDYEQWRSLSIKLAGRIS